MHGRCGLRAGQGRAATVAAQAENERGLWPAGAAQRALLLDQCVAGQALWWIDRAQQAMRKASRLRFDMLCQVLHSVRPRLHGLS